MAEARASPEGAFVRGFALRERPVEPEVPVPSPDTRARMDTGDDEQVAREEEEAAYEGAVEWTLHRLSGHGKPAGAELRRRAFSTNHARSHSTTHLVEWMPRGLGPAARRVEWKPLRAV
jgi:hypothetical protein